MTFQPSIEPIIGAEGPPPPHVIWREGCETQTKAWPTFENPDVAWHGPFGDIVRQLDPETEADPVAVGFDLLISFGNVIGPSAHMNVGGAHHDGRLFGVIVGNSSKARKGTSQRLVMSILRHLDSDWYRHRQLRGIASGEALIDFAAGKIQRPDEFYNDPLKRTMIREDELARLLAASGREGSTLGSVMRDAWEQDQLSTVSRTATSMVEGAHISMSAHITAYELEQRLTTTDIFNGFANRCIWLMAKRSKLLPSGGNLTDEDFGLFAEALRRPVKQAVGIGRMKRTPAAEHLWRELYQGPLSAEEPGVVGVLTARAEPQVIRLSMLFALLDCSPRIDVEHVEQAYQWWQLSAKSVAYLFGNPDDGLTPDEGKLLRALRSAGCAGLTQTDQYRKVFGSHRDRGQIKVMREHLIARELAWTAATPGDGDRSALTTWALVPGTRADW